MMTIWLVVVGVLAQVVPAEVPAVDAQRAERILESSGVSGGLIVHVGCADGRLTAALGKDGRYLVHGLDRDADQVAKARRYIQSLGIYGRVSAAVWSGGRLPYAENLVNLLVWEAPPPVSIKEVMRVLVPGGTAYISKRGKWTKVVKPWPEQIDQWTHWLHDASGNAVARDRVVGPPRRIQWNAGPLWQRHHDTVPSTTAMVSGGGRLFYISDEAPSSLDGSVPDKWVLVARDAFNGVLLWKRRIEKWGWSQWSGDWRGRFNEPPQLPKRLVAVGDRVYTTLSFNASLTALDAATGRTLKVYKGTENTDEILYYKGLLILSVAQEARTPSKHKMPPVKKSVCVLDADSGEVLWRTGEYTGLRGKFNSTDPFGRLELAAGADAVFLVDQDAILSLEVKTGRERWRVPRPPIEEHRVGYGIRMSDMCVLVYQDDVVLFAQPEMKKKRSWHSLPGTLYAYRAENGKFLWKHQYGGWAHNWQPDVFVIDGLVWVHEHQPVQMQGHDIRDKSNVDYAVIGLDLMTGELRRRLSTKQIFDVGHHHRCYRNKATERFLLCSRRGVEFVDLASGRVDLNHWGRGACLYGVMPCNGLLYLTPHPCDCYIATKLNGYFALAAGSADSSPRTNPQERAGNLQTGPAYTKTGTQPSDSSPAGPDEWPTFRHDYLRSGSTQTAVPTDLEISWSTTLGGRLSPPVVAGEKLFVASIDRHTVVALDAGDGREVWSFTAGGRVGTPPTVYDDLVLFGSADGWVYCLRASDGQLAWRRRVAPGERLVGAFGQLESAWPVPGSVLVVEDVAYVPAGRSSYLDGGIYLYALAARTGKILEEKVIYSPDPNTGRMPAGDYKSIPGVLADILVSDGSSVFMRQETVFGRGSGTGCPLLATGGFRDESWFNRTQWLLDGAIGAQLVVFDKRAAYGIRAYPGTSRSSFFHPGGKGYTLFAAGRRGSAESPAGDRIRPLRKTGKPQKALWTRTVPIRATSMVLAKGTLFVAGPPDTVDPNDPLAAFEGRRGGVLWALSAQDGSKLASYKLAHEPVFDGLIAAAGRLYLSLKNGKVLCIGKGK